MPRKTTVVSIRLTNTHAEMLNNWVKKDGVTKSRLIKSLLSAEARARKEGRTLTE